MRPPLAIAGGLVPQHKGLSEEYLRMQEIAASFPPKIEREAALSPSF